MLRILGSSDASVHNKTNDRAGFATSVSLVKRTDNFYNVRPLSETPKLNHMNRTPKESFAPPLKGTAHVSEGLHTVRDDKPKKSSFKAPVKATSNEQSSFIPPVKTPTVTDANAPSSVATSKKRSLSPVQSESPMKKAKVDFQDVNDDVITCSDGSRNVKVVVSSDVKKSRAKARLEQAKAIKEKRDKGKVKPFPGSLFQIKSASPRPSLREFVMDGKPQSCTPQQVITVIYYSYYQFKLSLL